MKTFTVLTLSLLASIANAQRDTNAVIFSNGNAPSVIAGTIVGHSSVGGLFYPIFPWPSSGKVVVLKQQVDQSPVYPNPSSGSFTVEVPRIGNHIEATLYNESGAVIVDATRYMSRVNDQLQFILPKVPSGSYMLAIADESHHYTYKLSIETMR